MPTPASGGRPETDEGENVRKKVWESKLFLTFVQKSATMNTEQLTQEAIALLGRLIETPRISREEGAAADLLARWMTERGMAPRREGNNLWCLSPDYQAERPTLLLCAHIDTVRPVSGWKRNPHQATVEGERLYGLGANDDGASLVCLLQVFRQLQETERDHNLVFLATAEEEVSGRNGIERALPLLPAIDVALVGEPTGMQPAIAEKGLMVLDCTAAGRAGHAARDEGDNAIYRALDDIQWIRSTQFPEVSPLLGPTKMTVTVIGAGTQHNVVPDRCSFIVDVRTNELHSNEDIYNRIRAHVKSEVVARSFRLGSSRITTDHPLVRRAVALGRTPYGSPTLSDQSLLRCPSLKMGPGESSRSHTADDYIELSEIRQGIELYLALLTDLRLNAQSTPRD